MLMLNFLRKQPSNLRRTVRISALFIPSASSSLLAGTGCTAFAARNQSCLPAGSRRTAWRIRAPNRISIAPICTVAEPKSSALSNEDTHPTQQSLVAYIKDKASRKATRKLFQVIEESEEGTSPWGEQGIRPDAIAYRIAIRSLLKCNRTDLAIALYRQRMQSRIARPTSMPPDHLLAASVIKAVLRDCKKRGQRAMHAQDVFDEVMGDCKQIDFESLTDVSCSDSTRALFSILAAFIEEKDQAKVYRVVSVLLHLSRLSANAAVPVEEYNTAIRLLGKFRAIKCVMSILEMMKLCEVEKNNETFEFLANAAVRQVHFVTGAVSMATLPEPLNAEVAFVGRSNVGKSSLVNMICNRKALAYVSGRPGKTQQFNYFLVNERDKESQFYMVDLPGVGFAKVPQDVKAAWIKFMAQYFQYRTSLRLIFHLIDGRHGASADDEELMEQIAMTGRSPEYVVVLTKMDKMDKQRVKQSIIDKTRSSLVRNHCPPDTPIILTSANTKLGRDEMWRHLQDALGYLGPKNTQM